MKIIITSIFVVALVYAELPSNSYLPPPSSSFSRAGYPQAPASATNQNFAPQIIAARTLESAQRPANGAHNPLISPFGRSNHAAGRFANEEPAGYDSNAANFARNTLEEIKSEPANYNFGYMVNDYQEGTDFGHHEQRQAERAQGEYHVVLPDGRKQTVSYEADERGFKPQISYEDAEDLARSSGYDSNANNVRSGGNHGGHFENNGGKDNFGVRSNGY